MLDEKFTVRMKKLLGEEYAEFENALSLPAVRAVRVNTVKASAEEFFSKNNTRLIPIPYCEDGYIAQEAESLGNSPEHHAGEIYIQDPGAMSALSSLEIKRGCWVLDLCSAPGGKSSQAAAKIGPEGFLLSNEFVPKRAKICVGNFERLGITNAMVTSLDTAEFKKYFDSAFDLVILDAPCSGEGMFRKNGNALTEWSEENVKSSSLRQSEILENAAPLVKCGGYLIYSTCTYSLEENEMNVDAFVKRHPEYEIIPVRKKLKDATRDGIVFGGASESLVHTRRFYPHTSAGEGQFVALMRRNGGKEKPTILYTSKETKPTSAELSLIEKFFRDTLTEKPRGRIVKHGENLVLISHGCPILPKSVFSAGVLLGEIRHNVFHPSHQFFSAYGRLFKLRLELSRDDGRLTRYLSGEEIEWNIEGSGYCAVCFGKTPLGGGKLTGGKVKNHYPKGLRLLR